MSFIYIASPYSDPRYDVRRERFNAVMRYAVKLWREQRPCFSPIMHWHPAAVIHDLPVDFATWWPQDRAMLAAADRLHVLTLPGWEDSRGVQAEIRYWRDLFHKPEPEIIDPKGGEHAISASSLSRR